MHFDINYMDVGELNNVVLKDKKKKKEIPNVTVTAAITMCLTHFLSLLVCNLQFVVQ